jgi:hypothetical protein
MKCDTFTDFTTFAAVADKTGYLQIAALKAGKGPINLNISGKGGGTAGGQELRGNTHFYFDLPMTEPGNTQR